MGVRDPNVVPVLGWWLSAIGASFFAVSWLILHRVERKWTRVAKYAEPIVLDRQMVERMRQSGIERMPR